MTEILTFLLNQNAPNECLLNDSQCGAFDSFTEFSVFSKPAVDHNFFCLGFCSRGICPKSQKGIKNQQARYLNNNLQKHANRKYITVKNNFMKEQHRQMTTSEHHSLL